MVIPPEFRSFFSAGIGRIRSSRVLRDSSILFTGNWFNLVVAIITSALLARILGPDAFGLVKLSMTAVSFIVQFIDAQTDEALIRFMGNALARGERDEAITFFYVGVITDMGVALLALVVVILVVPPIIGSYPQGEVLQQLVGIFLLTTPFTILLGNFESVFKTLKRFRLSTTISMIVNVFSLFLLVILATQGEIAVIWGYVVVTLIRFTLFTCAAVWLLRTNLGEVRGRNYRETWRRLIPFVFHTSFMGSLKSVASNVDTLLLGAVAGASAVSYFDIARNAVNLIALPVTPVATVIYPMMNEAWALNNLSRVRYLIRRYMLLSGVISCGIVLGFILLSDFVVGLIYGAEFLPAANLIRILGIGVFIEAVMAWVRMAALAHNKPQLVTVSSVAASLISIPLAALLILNLGVVGAALGWLAAVLLMLLMNVLYVLPRLGLSDIFFRGAREARV